MSSKKSNQKSPAAQNVETSIAPKTLSAFWWKLSVTERNKHFHALKIFLLSPILFAQECHNKVMLCKMAVEIGKHVAGQELSDNEIESIETLENAVNILQEHMSKFDKSAWLLEDMIKSIQEFEKQKPDNMIKCPRHDQWLKHLKKNLTQLNRDKTNERDAAIVFTARHVCRYIQELKSGVNHLELYNDLSVLMEPQIVDEKLRGNSFFKEELYEQAIAVYTNILACKPLSHIIYCNRAKCYLIQNQYRLALADAKRTIVLEPSYDKGHYRYAESLENLNRIDDAILALKRGANVCQPKESLEKYLSKLMLHAEKKKKEIKLKKTLPTYPPELIWPKSDDESSVDDSYGGPVLNLCGCSDCNNLQKKYETSSFDSHDAMFCDHCYPFYDEDQTDSDENNTDSDFGTCSSSISKSSKGSSRKGKNKSGKRNPVDSPVLKLYAEMRKGTEHLLARNFITAKSCYSQVLGLLSSKKELSMPRNDEVVLIYAHGISCFEIAKPKDIKLARSQFNRIIENFKDIYFPLAYYGYGRVLHKQSKFYEMRLMLMRTIDFLEKKDISLTKWPGSDIIIEETRPGKLKEAVVALLDSLSTRTIPDAICKYVKCNLTERYISFKDHDFKGFVRILCSESCRIEYHTCCWKRLKLDFQDKMTEREMLNRPCVTPDCSGIFYHILMYAKSNGCVEREFKAEIVKKLRDENHPVDKSKRMTSCSYKKQQKKLRRLREKDHWSEERIKKTNDDIENILKELDEEDEQFRIQEKPPNPFIDKDKLPLFFTGNQKPPPIPPEPAPPEDFNFYILHDAEDSVESSKTPKGKRKDKKKKKKTKETQSLVDFLGPEEIQVNHESTADSINFERSNSISSSITSISTDAPSLPPDPSLVSSSNENADAKTMESNVKEHLFTIFEDLLISKGSMDVENDQDVQDLVNILDVFSTDLINNCGGLKHFLSLSPKFVFDPDDPNVVFPADEAEIFLQSRKEAALHKRGNKNNFTESNSGRPSVSNSANNGVSETNTKRTTGNAKNCVSEPKTDRPSGSAKNVASESSNERPTNGDELKTTKSNLKIPTQDTNNFKGPTAQFANPLQPPMTRPLFNPFTDFAGMHGQNIALKDTAPHRSTQQSKADNEGKIVKGRNRANLPVRNAVDELKTFGEKFRLDKKDRANQNKPRQNNETNELMTEYPSEALRISDSMQKELKAFTGKFRFIDNSIVKEMYDVAVMTDENEDVYKEMYEKEVAEKNQLTEKYDDLLDSFEQFKKRAKLEKDTFHSTEEDLKAKLQELTNNLTKERQARDKEQKKWQHEKETFKDKISSLDKKMSRSEEARYKKELAEKDDELKKSFEKIGDLRLQFDRERLDNEDIIKKLGTCVNEQSKRAQKAEVLYLELEKSKICSGFKSILLDANSIIFALDRSPFIDPSINRKELRKAWMTYSQNIEKNFSKCRADFDERLGKVKSGIPLEEIPAFTVPQSPVQPLRPGHAPPQPPNNQNQVPMNLAPPNGMPIPVYIPHAPHQNVRMIENSDSKEKSENADSHPSVHDSAANTMSGAVAHESIANGIKAVPHVNTHPAAALKAQNGFKHASSSSEHFPAKINPAKIMPSSCQNPPAVNQSFDNPMKFSDVKDSYAKDLNMNSKASNFDRILVRLGAKFPQYGRPDLIKLLKDFREQRNNTLSGLSAEDIIESISKIIIRKTAENLKQSEKPRKPIGLKPNRGAVATNNESSFGFEEPCIICHEDMHHVSNTTRLQCGHVFHTECIRRWLNEQRTCPTCRDHALLQEDFPTLH